MHCQRVFHRLHSVLLSSSDTICTLPLPLLLFLARYFDVVYLLDLQLLVCKLIKFDASHKPPGRLSQLCGFGHINGVPLTYVKWNVNAVFGLCCHGNLFCVCSSKKTLQSSRIATYTKTQHIYCRQFAEQILSVAGTDSGDCWNPNSSISRIESASKTMWFFVYPSY